MKQYLVDKNIIEDCLSFSEHEANLRKLWKKYDPYYVFSKFVKLEKKDLDRSLVIAQSVNRNVDFQTVKKDIIDQEIKLAIILLMNEISHIYSKKVTEFDKNITLDNPKISDDILIDFTVSDYSTDDEIAFEVYTVRRLMLRK